MLRESSTFNSSRNTSYPSLFSIVMSEAKPFSGVSIRTIFLRAWDKFSGFTFTSIQWITVNLKSSVMIFTITKTTVIIFTIRNLASKIFLVVVCRVLSPFNYLKVSNSIVKFFMVYVMNNFIFLKLSLKKFFHNKSMLKNMASISKRINNFIAFIINKTFSFYLNRLGHIAVATKSFVMNCTKSKRVVNPYTFMDATIKYCSWPALFHTLNNMIEMVGCQVK